LKAKINLILDALLLLALGAMSGIGLLIKNVLVPGFRRWDIYGRNVELTFWGLGRHEWGMIHYAIGIGFAVLVVLHVVLHWPMVVAMGRKLIGHRLARRVAAVLLLAAAVALALLPILAKPEVHEPAGRGHGRGHGHGRHVEDVRPR